MPSIHYAQNARLSELPSAVFGLLTVIYTRERLIALV
jgi:hypothetical protein